MKTFAFIGAGSMQFTTSCICDLLHFPAFRPCEIRLMDTNPQHLAMIEKVVRRLTEAMDCPDCRIIATGDRAEALQGSDGVLCTVFNGDVDVWRHEIEIPKKYGIDMNVGDTRSVAGIFRALRNIPLMLDICHDIERYCPHAVFLNYTNPMSMLCGAMQKHTNVEVTGLCHSVQHTIDMLAGWLNIPTEEIVYTCQGINHMAFYTRLEHNGESLYPRLRDLVSNDRSLYEQEMVRNEMFLKLGYYVTESSGHASEYNQWFRKRPELIEQYCTKGNWNPGLHRFSLDLRLQRQADGIKQYEDWLARPVSTARSVEYAAEIFNARIGDGKPYIFNGNVINHGSIANLPEDACVEVPVVADRMGFRTTIAGALPANLATFVSTTAQIENMVIEAAITQNKDLVYQAVYLDPLSSAVCSLEEIRQMCDELFEANRDYLGDYR